MQSYTINFYYMIYKFLALCLAPIQLSRKIERDIHLHLTEEVNITFIFSTLDSNRSSNETLRSSICFARASK